MKKTVKQTYKKSRGRERRTSFRRPMTRMEVFLVFHDERRSRAVATG